MPKIFGRNFRLGIFKNQNSKIQKMFPLYLYICFPSFYFGFFFFFFDRFLILLTFHLFCSVQFTTSITRSIELSSYKTRLSLHEILYHEFMMIFMNHDSWVMNFMNEHWWRSKLSVSDNRILNRKEKNGLIWNERDSP